VKRDGRRDVGRRGEDLAAEHLRKAGYRLIDRNVRTRYGEIDLVAEDNGCLVFVEVRTVRYADWQPEESVTVAKQKRVAALSRAYLALHEKDDADWRADVIAIAIGEDGRPLRLEHYVSAVEE
jgi:putative endonuclease